MSRHSNYMISIEIEQKTEEEQTSERMGGFMGWPGGVGGLGELGTTRTFFGYFALFLSNSQFNK